jgi:hypothetical protein
MTMEVLRLDWDLVDANLVIRDVREVVASGSPGDMMRFGSRFAVAVESRYRGINWLGGIGLIDKRDSGDRDWDDRGQLCMGGAGGASTMSRRLALGARAGAAMARTEWMI